MTDYDNLKAALEIVEGFTARAVEIVKGAPFHKYIPEPCYAHLLIDGDEATVEWPEAESDYDSSSLSDESKKFPAALLFLSDEEFAAWKRNAIAAEKIAHEQYLKNQLAQREAKQRADYEALKQKFEPATSPSPAPGEGK